MKHKRALPYRMRKTQATYRPYCRGGSTRVKCLRQKSAKLPTALNEAFFGRFLLLFEELRERWIHIGYGSLDARGLRLRREGCGIGCA